MSILKKIFFLSLFLLFISGLFWGVYNLSFKSQSKAKPEIPKSADGTKKTDAENSSQKDSGAREKKISAITQEAVISPVSSQDGSGFKYYEKNSGQAFEADFLGGAKKNISPLNVPNIENVSWSLDRFQAVLKIKKPEGGVSFVLHNFQTGTDTPIKDNVDEVSWQTNANRIFYKYYDSKNSARSLNVSDPSGSNWLKIADVSYRDIRIAQIPKSGVVSFWNKPDAYAKTIFQMAPIAGGETKTVFEDAFGADYLWDGSGSRALISRSNEKGGNKIQLGIINYGGSNYRDLNIPTFSSKCVWSENGKTVFYALPGEIPENSVLPNDYMDGKFMTADTFWEVDVETGEKTRIVETNEIEGRYDASSLFLNSSESLLLFVNRIDGKLYKIIL